MKILIIDDETIITNSLSILIKVVLKNHVIVYNDPLKALQNEALKNSEIDLIISDFMMPGMNGLEFLIKAKELCPSVITIILTGYADKEKTMKSINEVGLYYYLEKPWNNDELVKIISNGLEKKRLSDSLKEKIVELEKSKAEIEHLYNILEDKYVCEKDKNEILERKVVKRTASIKNLLNNSGQGFLTFGANLLVDEEYSLECKRIFNEEIKNYKFTDLLYKNEPEKIILLDNVFKDLLINKDVSFRELYFPLLPDDVNINNKQTKI